jgi:hypothetical protein
MRMNDEVIIQSFEFLRFFINSFRSWSIDVLECAYLPYLFCSARAMKRSKRSWEMF